MRSILIATAAALLAGCPSSETAPAPPPAASPAPAASGERTSPPICAAEIARICDAGFSDGCGGQKTTRHVCVADDAPTGGPPCDQEIAAVCPAGQVDACSIGAATAHFCVVP